MTSDFSQRNSIPEGIQSILNTCQSLYPDQPNPRQVAAQLKFWLGGPDPLDYVSIYYNAGEEGVCVPHWHYVSMGLSDLHGDERVHDRDLCSTTNSDKMSGFGFELTFRVKVMKDQNESPPIWPVELMQLLASYIFSSHTDFKAGDYVSWNSPIDKCNSLLTQLFIVEDAQLSPAQTKFGWVSFLQVVGVSADELNAAQSWKVVGMVDLMKEHMSTGGPYQVCDQHRSLTIFQVSGNAKSRVNEAIKQEECSFSGFSTECDWVESNDRDVGTLTPVSPHHFVDPKFAASWTDISGSSFEAQEPKRIREVTLTLCIEAFLLLPMVLRGRINRGEHFTFRSSTTDVAITLVPEGTSGTLVSSSAPYAAKCSWLQVYTPVSLMEELLSVVDAYYKQLQHKQKSEFDFPSYSLHLIVLS